MRAVYGKARVRSLPFRFTHRSEIIINYKFMTRVFARQRDVIHVYMYIVPRDVMRLLLSAIFSPFPLETMIMCHVNCGLGSFVYFALKGWNDEGAIVLYVWLPVRVFDTFSLYSTPRSARFPPSRKHLCNHLVLAIFSICRTHVRACDALSNARRIIFPRKKVP